MVAVEYWLDTLAHVQPPNSEDWLAINGHRVAPYAGLCEISLARSWRDLVVSFPPHAEKVSL